MRRLIKKANNDDEMSFDEIKEETIQALKNMSHRSNEWAIRDALVTLTSFDFYKGEQMVAIDGTIAKDICQQTINYVNGLTKYNEQNLFEVYDQVYNYSW